MSNAMGVNYASWFSALYRGWDRSTGSRGSDPLELLDAYYECEHGHLSVTSPARCRCFGVKA